MPARKLSYKIDTDTSAAVKSLAALGKAGDRAGKDLADAFDDAESAAESALKALNDQLDKLETESKGTAQAVEKIGEAFGEGADSSKIEGMVGDLRRLGLSFDDVEAHAEQFAQVIKRADNVQLDGVRGEVDQLDRELDEVKNTGDQTGSVLANAAGNAAGEMGELAGVGGVAAGAIGQLAEYATEGNIALGELAGAAGPMVGLAAATFLVQKGMEGMAKAKAFDTDQVDAFATAMREGGSAAQVMFDTIQETGRIDVSVDGMFGGVRDLLPIMDRLGISFTEFQRLATDPAAFQAMVDYRDSLDGAGDAAARTDILKLLNGINAYNENINAATELQDRLNRVMEVTPEMVQGSASAFREARDFTVGYSDAWAELTDFLANGGRATAETAAAMETLTEASGETQDEIWAIAQSKVDDKLTAVAGAVDEAAAAMAELDEATRGAALTMRSEDFDSAGAEAAASALQEFWDTTVFGSRTRGIEFESAYDDLGAALEAATEAGLSFRDSLNIDSPEGRAVQGALKGLADEIVPSIAEAFDASDGSIEDFRRRMHDLGEGTINRLQQQFGLTRDEANALAIQLGLVPENVETTYQLLGDADALAKLELLQGYIDELPTDVQTEVAMHVLADDPQAALATVQSYITNHPPKATMVLDSSKAASSYAGFKYSIESQAIVAPLRLGSTSIARGTAANLSAGATATATPTAGAVSDTGTVVGVASSSRAAPVVNVNLNVSAGVVGNRFDVQRAVRASVRDLARLGLIAEPAAP